MTIVNKLMDRLLLAIELILSPYNVCIVFIHGIVTFKKKYTARKYYCIVYSTLAYHMHHSEFIQDCNCFITYPSKNNNKMEYCCVSLEFDACERMIPLILATTDPHLFNKQTKNDQKRCVKKNNKH